MTLALSRGRLVGNGSGHAVQSRQEVRVCPNALAQTCEADGRVRGSLGNSQPNAATFDGPRRDETSGRSRLVVRATRALSLGEIGGVR